ncbi:MAG: hypothetical protein FWE07_04505 [Turicibacter sp.]|nr:hypothetical protein [Turicibacter sp.]
MEELENKNEELATDAPVDEENVEAEKESEILVLFKSTSDYVVNFIKAPVTTLRLSALESKEAAIVTALLPLTLFVSLWSFTRSMVNAVINSMVGFMGTFGMPSSEDIRFIRAEILSEVNWGSLFLDSLLISTAWFALMMFTPFLITKLLKSERAVDLHKLFQKVAAITIPASLLFLVAAAFGFIGLSLWLIPMAVSLVLPLILHFFVNRDIFNETPNKTLYITFITQVIIMAIVVLWLNARMSNAFADMMGSFFW